MSNMVADIYKTPLEVAVGAGIDGEPQSSGVVVPGTTRPAPCLGVLRRERLRRRARRSWAWLAFSSVSLLRSWRGMAPAMRAMMAMTTTRAMMMKRTFFEPFLLKGASTTSLTGTVVLLWRRSWSARSSCQSWCHRWSWDRRMPRQWSARRQGRDQRTLRRGRGRHRRCAGQIPGRGRGLRVPTG